MKKLFFLLMALSTLASFAQKTERPKLVVGIVVDQMRYDYLVRFADKFGDDGFKKIISKGFHLENAHYNYIPTYTAVGHSSIFTGTTPSNHGIIGNNWYDKFLKKSIYCVDDSRYTSLGVASKAGQKSPYRLHVTTIADQLKLAQNNKGKSIGIAIKDRSAILPVGHTANAAYWFEGGKEGKFISSSFYGEALPSWVTNFNSNGKVASYVNQVWNTYYPIENYTESMVDDNMYEGKFKGEEKPVFPHDIPTLKNTNGNYSILKGIPLGNTITTDFAEAAIVGENLGKYSVTDFLSISYSSTDYVGHKYGVDSKEIEDTYIRMDFEIARLLKFLDKQVGKKKYTLFLTADHAVAQTPNYLKELHIPAAYFDDKGFNAFVKQLVNEKFGSKELIENISNYQIFLNKKKLKELKLSSRVVEEFLVDEVVAFENIYKTVSAHTLQNTYFDAGLLSLVQRGYNQKLSGDVFFIPNPATLSSGYKHTGTSHGTGYSYDTHVPMIFYGFGINQGSSKKYQAITAIAPTISSLLQIEFPNGNTGTVIEEVLK
ncbi:alkaline phosphatase PafA [Flavicella sediminum]|uniref:alkaline phosphatase PafA n=1 Tax=Flavicella sediminum TaxID=2585141 RepID=UPI00111D522E|nr:alkaline phosphatase PafA [Flavicella sediminum]